MTDAQIDAMLYSVADVWENFVEKKVSGVTMLEKGRSIVRDAMAAAAPADSDTVQVIGVRSDGSEHVLGTARTPPKTKARELVREMFGPFDEEAGDDGAMALWCCENLLDWLGKDAQAIQRFVPATPAVPTAEARDAARYRSLRRGQKWSVINGIGDALRATELDAAIDAAISATPPE